MSTGIGPDNIDIVINELDALVNIDLETRRPKETLTSLNIIRIGTSGSLQLIFLWIVLSCQNLA
jgi:uridine phosphorylase